MERIDSQLFAPYSNILSGQHGGIGRGLVPIGFDFHAARHAGDGFAAAGITQVSLWTLFKT